MFGGVFSTVAVGGVVPGTAAARGLVEQVAFVALGQEVGGPPVFAVGLVEPVLGVLVGSARGEGPYSGGLVDAVDEDDGMGLGRSV